MPCLVQHFRRQVSNTATETSRTSVVSYVFLGQPEVSEFGMALFVQHHVVRFQIPLDNIVSMQMFNRQEYLCNLEFGSIFIKFL